MKARCTLAVVALSTLGLSARSASLQSVPGDTYFSLAVTENSHNHSGARRLFLDFQEAPFTVPDASLGEVASLEVAAGAITLDGDDAEWDPTYLTTVAGLVQNNYPLSEYIDAVRTDILVGSAWDVDFVYFLVQWVDAGHSASNENKKWIFGDQGAGETGWNSKKNVGSTVGAHNELAVNATGHVLSGKESEDRVFMMFPITDTEANFTDGGPGCALYCHTNLLDDFPWQNHTGSGVTVMHTNVPGDEADIWHWKSTRTQPSGYADEKYIEFAVGSASGRKSDAGSSAYSDNNLSFGDPEWMHPSGLSYTGDALQVADAVVFSGVPTSGTEIPRYISRAAMGSRADVETQASFDAGTSTWTVEFRRQRDTGNPDDHSFELPDLAPPTVPLVTTVDVAAGAMLYMDNCIGCHGAGAVGSPFGDVWAVPRAQRASGSQLLKAFETGPVMMVFQGTFTDQEIEDMAAYLQTQATFLPVRTLSTVVVGAPGTSVVTSEPSGIDCPATCSFDFTEGTPVTLHAEPVPGHTFVGWSGPCSGTGDCSFTLEADTTVTATYVPDCSVWGYCMTSPNSAGPGAVISASGTTSIAANDLTLNVTGAVPDEFGLFYYGPTQLEMPFGDGLRCVGGGTTGTFRLNPPQRADASGDSSRLVDFTAAPAVSGPGALLSGSVWYFQYLYRDPTGPGGSSFNSSDGLGAAFCP